MKYIPSRSYGRLEDLAVDLLSRTDDEKAHQKVFFKEKGGERDLLSHLMILGYDGEYYEKANRLVLSNDSLITFHHIDKHENRPVNTLCGVQLTTVVFLDIALHDRQDVMYALSRLRSHAHHEPQAWYYLGDH